MSKPPLSKLRQKKLKNRISLQQGLQVTSMESVGVYWKFAPDAVNQGGSSKPRRFGSVKRLPVKNSEIASIIEDADISKAEYKRRLKIRRRTPNYNRVALPNGAFRDPQEHPVMKALKEPPQPNEALIAFIRSALEL